MKIKMSSDSFKVQFAMEDFAENGIEIKLDDDVKVENDVTVELSVVIKRDEKFGEDD